MAEVLRAASFLLFLLLGLRVRRLESWRSRRSGAAFLIGYVLVLSAVIGVLQWDDWPFTCHNIAVGRARADSRICMTHVYGVDRDGREWRMDPYSWTPVYDSILQFWLEQGLPRLTPPERERVLAFLLERAERSRRRLAAGRPIGYQRLLGAAGAPYWLLLPRAGKVPSEPYAGLRTCEVCWTPARLLAGDEGRVRRVTAEYWKR